MWGIGDGGACAGQPLDLRSIPAESAGQVRFLAAQNGFVGILRSLQDPQPLDVVCQAHQFPFSADLRKAPKQELPEAHHVLDDSEHRLDRLLPSGVQTPAGIRPQLLSHVQQALILDHLGRCQEALKLGHLEALQIRPL